jgi:hypothetical protein
MARYSFADGNVVTTDRNLPVGRIVRSLIGNYFTTTEILTVHSIAMFAQRQCDYHEAGFSSITVVRSLIPK